MRFYIHLAAAVGGGFWFALTMESGTRQEGYQASADLLWFLAMVVVVSGTATLILFVRRNPVFASGSHSHGQ